MAGLTDVLQLEPHGPDTFVGSGPRYPWGGLYGGQIVAQALRAATATVAVGLRPHSLRAYFIRAGDQDQPVRYEVDRLRDGRSFTTRRVVARQTVGAILNLEASFTAGDDGAIPGRQGSAPPAVASFDELPSERWSDLFDRRVSPLVLGSGRSDVWVRWASPLPDDPVEHETALAYLSDDVPSESIKALALSTAAEVADFDSDWFMVSLDHTVWFHEPQRADEWQLHSFRCDRFVAGRGLTIGEVFGADGRHVATIAQEMLLRRRRPAS